MITCIYKISNSIDSRIYIGSAVNFQNRKLRHIRALLKNTHCNDKIQYFVNKYGIDSIYFEVVEQCEKENLIEREQFYIDTFDCVENGFNILRTAGSWLNHHHSEKSKEKISSVKKGIQSTAMLGKKHTKETKELISKKAIGRKQSDETIQKRVEKNKGKKRPESAIQDVRKKLEKLNREQILQIREMLNNNVNQHEIAKKFGVCQRTISRIKRGESYYDVF
jgi:group I intron endonuclease